MLINTLNSMSAPTVEALSAADTPIRNALASFNAKTISEAHLRTVFNREILIDIPEEHTESVSEVVESTTDTSPRPAASIQDDESHEDNGLTRPQPQPTGETIAADNLFLGVSANLWLKFLCNTSAIIGFLSLVACTSGAALAIAGASYVTAGILSGGAALGSLLSAFGIFGIQELKDREFDVHEERLSPQP